jgi:hypothetical protein
MKPSELFSREGSWIRDNLAKDANGYAVDFDSQYAVCWCLVGGLRHCLGDSVAYGELVPALLLHITPYASLTEWNDAAGRTREEVVALLKENGY